MERKKKESSKRICTEERRRELVLHAQVLDVEGAIVAHELITMTVVDDVATNLGERISRVEVSRDPEKHHTK